MAEKRKAKTEAEGSKDKKKKMRAQSIDDLTAEEVNTIIDWMKSNKMPGAKKDYFYLEKKERGWTCNLAATTTHDGCTKIPSISILLGLDSPLPEKFWYTSCFGDTKTTEPSLDSRSHVSHVDKDDVVRRTCPRI